MAGSIHKRASAKRDLVEHYVYLAENAGIETAERFLLNADNSFGDLARHPGMGAPVSLRSPQLAGLRKWQVGGFERILIFYLPRAGGVSIVRVLHAAQDWWSILGIL
jgi:toxin ParE1/3/4